MSGDLLKAARNDYANISSSGGFEEDIEMISPNGGLTISFKNLHSKHHLRFDSDGNAINSMTAHVSVSRKLLDDLNYPYKNSKGKPDFEGHIVNVSDSAEIKKYVVTEFLPSETFGVFVLILGNCKNT